MFPVLVGRSYPVRNSNEKIKFLLLNFRASTVAIAEQIVGMDLGEADQEQRGYQTV